MKWYPYGHDFGNAEMGGVTVINGRTVSLSVPTAFAKADISAMNSLGVKVDQSNTHTIRFYGEELAYSVGELALQQSIEVYHGRGDIQRYASRYSLRGLLTIASSLIPDPEFGLHVVTGLPAETYIKNLSLRNNIKAALDGKHVFTTDNGKTWRSVTIEVATVVMEGAGALIAYGDKSASKTTESAVIDIGGRTTDLYVARGQVPVAEYCKGKPLGVETATQMLIDTFENKYERPLSLLEAREIMYAYASNGEHNYPDISVYGKAVGSLELDRLAKEAVNQVGSEIVSFVAMVWRQSDRDAVAASFKPVLSIGGGVYYFYRVLKQRIPHLSRPDDPIHANALGYCTLAGRLLIRKVQANGVKA
ncbi:ParM/StbA family protein [Ktedonosporobacter rubrisoli]|uniref:ParM/StbA family protein n=1 Tax=Ktedonosporobacter rubrisoli TaxID=2509675 RepID=A0A4V0YZ05_KTERU|nr:ParM/StbA family protein [Ktedonosporobacter rubrisoli]QBD78041.1 ParM/StbA family protein [Ktedonosporobacter rubrisoli]